MAKFKEDAKIINIYKPSFWLKFFAWLQALWFVLLGIPFLIIVALFAIVGNYFVYFIFALIFLVIAHSLWYAFMLTRHCSLIIYEDGLALERGNSRFFTTWENMSHLERFSWGNPTYGIALYDMAEPNVQGLVEKFLYSRAQDFFSFKDITVIAWNVWQNDKTLNRNLLQTDFGRDLYHYAPHLFEGRTEKAKFS